jgi:hypothetical protein
MVITSELANNNGSAIYNDDLLTEVNITQSCITGHSTLAVSIPAGAALTARDNWWGAADGPSGAGPGSGDAISAGVAYIPFLTEPGPGCGGPLLPTITPSYTPPPTSTTKPSATPSPVTLPPSNTPSITPTLTAANYAFTFVDFQPNGVVHYQIANHGPVTVTLSGFALAWAHTPSAAPLTSVTVGGVNAFDPAGVLIWQGSDLESPTVATSGRVPGWRAEAGYDPGWLTEVGIPAGQTVSLWFNFDGTTGRLDTDLGYSLADLAGSTLALAEVGSIEVGATPSNTPTITFTPSWTPLASHTPLPSPTSSPSMTHTPSKTPTRTATFTPSPTRTVDAAYLSSAGCVPLGDPAGTILCTQ